jgi:hypothetical protein
MSQFKIYGHAAFIATHATAISDAIHLAATGVLGLPEEKRFHRFFPMGDGMLIAPPDRSGRYIIIECVLFEGRSVAVKKQFYRRLLEELERSPGISAHDVEMTFIETPRSDWLIRGKPGDELDLTYEVERS